MTNPAKRIPKKHKEPNGKKTHIFCSENEEGKRKIGAVHCAQMCRKYTPNGKMGYPKWQNGIPQMAKWDIPNGKMGYPKWRNGTSQMGKWDTPKGEMRYPKRRNGIPQMAKWDTPNGEMGYPKW